jgi:RNA-directed DNA polymerase
MLCIRGDVASPERFGRHASQGRLLSAIAKKLGWRYTRYADDLTFSLPQDLQGKPRLGAILGLVKRVVEAEGFQINNAKTRVARSGGRQKITGLVVNGPQPPRVPRNLRRQIRAAIHNLKHGKPLHNGETPATLQRYAAYISMTDSQLGKKLLAALEGPSETEA